MSNRVEALSHRSRPLPERHPENDNGVRAGAVRRSVPNTAWRLSKEAMQTVSILLDMTVIVVATTLVVGMASPIGAFVAFLAAGLFVVVKALSNGYAR